MTKLPADSSSLSDSGPDGLMSRDHPEDPAVEVPPGNADHARPLADHACAVSDDEISTLHRTIEELRRENQAVTERLKLTRLALDNVAESSFTVDENARIIDVNNSACRRLGYSREELLSMSIADIDVHFTEPAWRLHWKRLTEVKNVILESRHRTRSGEIFPIEISVSYSPDDGGELAFSIVRDLSMRKVAEAALRDSEERFRQLADNIDDVFWMAELAADRSLRFIYTSPAYQKTWGRDIAGLYADSRTFLDSIYAADRDSVRRLTEQISNGLSSSCEYRIVRPNGSIRWLLTRGFPIRDRSNRVYRMGGITSDITEQRQRVTEQDTIAAVSRLLLTDKRLDEIYGELATTLAERLGFTFCSVEILNETSTEILFAGAVGLPGELATPLRAPLEQTMAAHVIRSGKTLVEHGNSQAAENVAPVLRKLARNSLIAVPIEAGGRIHGALVLADENKQEINDSLIEALQVIANQLAQHIHRQSAQVALLRSERDKAMILDSVPAFIWYKDCFNRIRRVNRLVADSMGLTPEEMQVLAVQEVYPETADRYYQDDLDVIMTGRPKLGIIEPMRLASGKQIWLRTDKIPELDETGRVCGILVFAIDVTDLKETEDKLRESQHRYAVATAAGKVGVWDWDLNSDYFFLDTNVKHLLGYTDYELPNSRDAWTRLIPPEEFEKIARATYEHLSGGTDLCVVEHRIRHKDGSYRYFLAQGKAIRDMHGTPIRITGAATDVTERRQAEESRRSADTRYRTLFNTSRDGIAFLDVEGRFEDANPAFLHLLGWMPEDLRQKTHAEITPSRWGVKDREMLQNILRTGDSGVYEKELIRKDNSTFRVSVNAWMVKEEPDSQGRILAIFRDVTLLKKAEERLRLTQSAVNQIDEGVIITDAEINLPGPRILYVNPGFTKITGYTSEDVVGKTPRILQGAKTDRSVLDRARRALKKGEAFEGEIVNYRKDGTEFTMQWVLSPIIGDDGRISHWVAIQRDVTKLRRATENTLKNERLAAIGEMVAGLAHEGRNALQRGQSGLFLLRKRLVDDPEKVRYITEIEKAQQALQTLFEEVRGYAVPIRLERRPTDLSSIWREVAGEVMEQTTVRFKLREEVGGIDLICRVDRFRMGQVFRNIFENCVAARPVGLAIEVVVREIKLDRNPGMRIEIRDNGPGLTPEERSRIFDPFYTTKTKGTGLGMAIVKRIVEAHGGDVAADSIPEKGTAIVLRLPREPM